jgi:predicted SprT family Zn-dependent metalloprotease
MNQAELKAACIAKVNESFDKADKHYGKVMPRCPVEFNSRMTSCGGRAWARRFGSVYQPTKVELSLPLLLLNGQKFIDEVPAHEVAHLVDGFHHSGTGHGRTWSMVMRRVMGIDDKRCHKLTTPEKRKTTKVKQLFCKCKEPHNVTVRMFNNVAEGTGRYSCRICHSYLTMGKNMGVRIEDVRIQIAASHEAIIGTKYKGV